ncbi:phosphoadenosine phosphosulfate reductase [Roseovarius sp. SCSIO 43702]|uniref:phosphoadenosine phosphosulfate reductase n=1 Tax=Roseovarius sp. SCSIO 43702 TaxID=2823043 RepID=UPI001C72AE11|nr:phosphoadenosine phosphosulfate reductase [Roseovarius sp. SCSIO 43702]QYX55278.1 phosphoadenosine phosphosulfate reductase [Roseovarius sp. SCSIO 43702]
MQDAPNTFDMPLSGLGSREAWLDKVTEVVDEDGYAERLGDRHAAIFVEEGKTLLVTFETHDSIARLSEDAQPMGWDMVKALGWSSLCLVSDGNTWFRSPRVYGYFDRLVDDGFFEEFDQVLFYGAGPCGYAAAAFSVAAPGAKVVLLQPQATLDPRIAEWDDRFLEMRRTSFDDRYGYAPDMIDAASHAFLLYDPEIELDAMHAALFTRSNVTRYRMRFLGGDLETSLMRMQILYRIFAQFSADKLDVRSLSLLYRHRRNHPGYQFRLLTRLTEDRRDGLTVRLARFVLARRNAPPFRKALTAARARLDAASDGTEAKSD